MTGGFSPFCQSRAAAPGTKKEETPDTPRSLGGGCILSDPLPDHVPVGTHRAFAFAGFSGEGGDAKNGLLNQPAGLTTDKAGDIFIVDSGNNRVRKLSLVGYGTPATVIIKEPQSLAGSAAAPLSIIVEVRDGSGYPVSGVTVRFAAQHAELAAQQGITDLAGRVSIALATVMGDVTVRASLPDFPSVVPAT